MALKIGLVGCGAIGTEIVRAVDQGEIPAELIAVCDRVPARAEEMLRGLKIRPSILGLKELVEVSELVVEAASQGALPTIAKATLGMGKDLMVMSVGALMDGELYRSLHDTAQREGCKIYIPSGAIAGLDGIKSAGMGRIERVTLTTTKNPRGFEGAPYVVDNEIDLHSLNQPTELFHGPAYLAVKAFPANVNVAATLSLAHGGEVMVRIIADPRIEVNIHEIAAEGDFGRITVRVENVPSPSNPKTSYLAALSAIATLKSIAEPVKIGT